MVEQLNFNTWVSTLIPGSVFDSRQAAEHYDALEERKLNAAAQRSDEELLSKLSPSALKNLASAFIGKAAMDTQETADYCTREFNKFTAKHTRFVVSVENSRRLASFLYGAGFHPPFNAQQFADAYDVLSVQGQLDLHDIRQVR